MTYICKDHGDEVVVTRLEARYNTGAHPAKIECPSCSEARTIANLPPSEDNVVTRV